MRRVHVIGRGAISTMVSVLLTEARLPVCVYGRGQGDETHLRLLAPDGERACLVENAPCWRRVLPSPGDLVFVALKWPRLIRELPELGQVWGSRVCFLLPQNGIVGTSVPVLGLDFIHPVVAHVSASMEGPDCVRLHYLGGFFVEEALVREYPELLRSGFRGIAEERFLVAQCIKLLIATTGARMALSNLSIGQALCSPAVRTQMAAVVAEGAAVLLAGMLLPHAQWTAPEVARIEAAFATGSLVQEDQQTAMGRATTSLHQDLEHRVGATEAPWINGWVVHEGERLEMRTPLNAFLLEVVERLARDRRTPMEAREDKRLQEEISAAFKAPSRSRTYEYYSGNQQEGSSP